MSKRRPTTKVKGRKLIKDKALVKFILQHLVKEEIDLSKMAIPSFSEILKSDEKDSRAFRVKYLNLKESNTKKSEILPPTFSLSLMDDIKGEENFLPLVSSSSF
jgi:hypothetical protein